MKVSSLQTVVGSYGFISDQFDDVAIKKQGAVPISSTSPNQELSINGVGLQKFYSLLTGDTTGTTTDNYLIEHNWAKQTGQKLVNINNSRIQFASTQIADMMSATVLVNKYTISYPLLDNDIENYPIKFDIKRKYSQGMTPTIDNITAIDVEYSDSETRPSYLQPALYYIQYCEKKETTTDKFTVAYDANAGTDPVQNVPATSAETSVGSCVTISDAKPTREGYTFLGWARNNKATKADSTYAAGKCYKGADGDITLYAIWKGNTTNNPSTGITSHIIAYIAIAGLGISGLILARKKGLFRQI